MISMPKDVLTKDTGTGIWICWWPKVTGQDILQGAQGGGGGGSQKLATMPGFVTPPLFFLKLLPSFEGFPVF